MGLSTVMETVSGLKQAGHGVNVIYFDFGGYYYSTWDAQLDGLMEQELEYLMDEYGLTEERASDVIQNYVDWPATKEAMNREILEGISYVTGGALNPGYIEMLSPRFYNYETDVMRVALSADEIEAMDTIIEEEDLTGEYEQAVKDATTPVSGYSPYYSKETIPAHALDRIKLNTIFKHFEERVQNYVYENTELRFLDSYPIEEMERAKQAKDAIA